MFVSHMSACKSAQSARSVVRILTYGRHKCEGRDLTENVFFSSVTLGSTNEQTVETLNACHVDSCCSA